MAGKSTRAGENLQGHFIGNPRTRQVPWGVIWRKPELQTARSP